MVSFTWLIFSVVCKLGVRLESPLPHWGLVPKVSWGLEAQLELDLFREKGQERLF